MVLEATGGKKISLMRQHSEELVQGKLQITLNPNKIKRGVETSSPHETFSHEEGKKASQPLVIQALTIQSHVGIGVQFNYGL